MFKTFLFSILIITGYSVTAAPTGTDQLTESIKRGKQVYLANCQSCHMEAGEGVPGVFPPLAKSDNLKKDPNRATKAVVHGMSGEITVNGQKYNMEMPAQSHLSDQEIADVVNYIQNNWGNKAKAVTPAQVKATRSK
ncbi:c-type cytochrome [Pontibacter arcticus]|uniref:Cytochrome c n=1 Tax=Pontibacter arcticus TaxID=2080288 RepID=A0A364RC68_9BACT|nr:cytochrome c [Pontibacter arcticus]RAU81869.1 cytochrome c [Pontibacter arcticus]